MPRKTVAVLSAFLLTACYEGSAGNEEAETDGGTGTAAGPGSGSGSGEPSTSSAGSTSGTDSSQGSDGSSSGSATETGGQSDEPKSDPLDGFPTGEEQWELLCARGHDDAIAQAFCAGDSPPQVTSLTELLELIGLGFEPGNLENAENGNPGFTMAYHSTAIGTRSVNPINPRAFVFTPPVGGVVFPPSGIPNPDLVIMAFARGEPFVELVANDPVDDELRFYLFRFVPPCEESAQGCNNAELLTPEIESDFVEYSLYDDGDIKNTVLDCLQCHQPDGPGTPKMLRMQEFEEGWTHWFYANRVQNREAMEQFVAAHDGEPYGGIPGEFLTQQMLLENNAGSARPIAFHLTLQNQGAPNPQPNEFPSQPIIGEREAAGCTCFTCANPPPLDPTDSCSPTWDSLYANTVQGNAIAAPYFDGHITDATKLAAATQAYRDTMDGIMQPDQMPDIRDVLLDEAAPYMSYAPAPGLTGREILQHLCQHCHNSSLDQTISRSNFNVEKLDTLPQGVKNEAIRRLELPDDDIERMPPLRFHTLSQAELDLVITELSE